MKIQILSSVFSSYLVNKKCQRTCIKNLRNGNSTQFKQIKKSYYDYCIEIISLHRAMVTVNIELRLKE